jgi:hypothetical protein
LDRSWKVSRAKARPVGEDLTAHPAIRPSWVAFVFANAVSVLVIQLLYEAQISLS